MHLFLSKVLTSPLQLWVFRKQEHCTNILSLCVSLHDISQFAFPPTDAVFILTILAVEAASMTRFLQMLRPLTIYIYLLQRNIVL